MTKKILVLGALSEMAEATCRLYAAEGAHFVLAGRSQARLQALADDLNVRGAAGVDVKAADLVELDPAQAVPAWSESAGGFDVILLAYGALGDQSSLERDLQAAGRLIDVNFRSAALWSLASANLIEAAGRGTLVVIGSVAGDRGRQSNYVYGATKAGLATLVEGISHRLADSGARAVLVKPGFVETTMTAHLPNKGVLWSSPDKIAKLIKRACERGSPVAYVPGYWRLIMTIIKLLPTPVFRRTRL